jgi:hypothetical protein
MSDLILRVSDFTRTPGPRLRAQGKFSAQEYLEDHLEPAYRRAREGNSTLQVILDGTYGYATSFLEESFGGLKRKHPSEDVGARLKIVSNDEPYLEKEIRRYISEAVG